MKNSLLLIAFFFIAFTQAQIVNIPDPNFKNALLNHNPIIDTNNDGEIQASEATAFVGEMNVSNKYISNLAGVEAFTHITKLNCSNNYLSSLELTNNLDLESLVCYANQLISIDISQNINLTYLECWSNQLSSLNISNNINLEYLNCFINQLNSLDVSNNYNLTELYCRNNQINSLDTSSNTNLTILECSSNAISNLDLTNNINLTILKCNTNIISNLDLSSNINLEELFCGDNPLSSLNVTNNTNLIKLSCGAINQLTSLDLSNNVNLDFLFCNNCALNNLDISNNTNLIGLHCDGNELNVLDTSNNTALKKLYCTNNPLNILNVSNNTNLTELDCGQTQLSNLNVSNNINLFVLKCNQTGLSNIDVSNNINLYEFNCSQNQLSNIDVSLNPILSEFDCSQNQLSNIDVSNNTSLLGFNCSHNLLTTIDVSNNPILRELNCSFNDNLTYINLKNGNNNNFLFDFGTSNFQNLPNLQTVCVDELNTDLTTFITDETGHPVTFTEYCSFGPAQNNTIIGNIKLDIDNNGCDTNDLPMPNVLIKADNGTKSFGTFTQSNGDYLLYTNDGDFTTQIISNLPNYFIINPNEQTNTFSGFDNTFTADFCIVPNQTINDVNITLIPTSQARPGFDTSYQIVYKNVGTTQLSGNVILEFDESKMSFVQASETVNTQSSNSLSFNYTALNPFETRSINVTFNINTPTDTQPVNIDDTLSFTATINPISGDNTTEDNVFTLNQTVVGSYDPNDITCLEGNQILLANADKYLHYVIRFQNSGTASAINVVVANDLDANLDWSTLQIENTSHNNRVAITNGNKIEFIFENINLPDSSTDEPNSHGFIAYKIKPKTTISLNDIIPNKANIFFDYNEAVETNTVITKVVNVLSVDENSMLDFTVYPIPAEKTVKVNAKTAIIKIELFSKLGKKLKETNGNKIVVSNLTQGLYFIKVEDINGNIGIKKIVKE